MYLFKSRKGILCTKPYGICYTKIHNNDYLLLGVNEILKPVDLGKKSVHFCFRKITPYDICNIEKPNAF